MTREERKDAIANLNMIRVAFIDTVTAEQGKLIDDTFRTAIEALRQEPKIVNLGDNIVYGPDGNLYKITVSSGKNMSKKPCEDAIRRQAVLDIVDGYSESQSNVEDVTQDIISDIVALPSVNLMLCEDAISRQAVIDEIFGSRKNFNNEFDQGFFADKIRDLPSVNPQEPKTGHWIISPNDCFATCSECGLHGDKGIHKHYGWCPKCGAKMIEPQESEVSDADSN